MAWDSRMTLKAAGVAQTASTSGTAIDLGPTPPVNKGQMIEFRLFWTAFAGTTPTIITHIEESADNITFRQVATFRTLDPVLQPNDIVFTPPNANGRSMARWGLVTQRYVRYRTVMAGAGVTLTFTIMARGVDGVQTDVDRLTF